MTTNPDNFFINDPAGLAALFDVPGEASLKKEVSYLHPAYQAMIAASPFAVLATVGPDGLDLSPRGDPPGFVQLQDEHTLLLQRFSMQGKLPKCVVQIAVETVFFQCARAIQRSKIWEGLPDEVRKTVPTPGAILEALTDAAIDGASYDRELPARQKSTLY